MFIMAIILIGFIKKAGQEWDISDGMKPGDLTNSGVIKKDPSSSVNPQNTNNIEV
jgi:hypothetical protein